MIQSNLTSNFNSNYNNVDFSAFSILPTSTQKNEAVNFEELSLVFLVLHMIRVNTVSPQWVSDYLGFNRSLSQDGRLILTKKDIANYVQSQGFEMSDALMNYILRFAEINSLIVKKTEQAGDKIISETYSWNIV